MKRKSLVCIILALSITVWQEVEPMKRVKKKYHDCKIKEETINELSEKLKNDIQQLTFPFLIKDVQRIILNAIPAKVLSSCSKKKPLKNIIFRASKKFMTLTVKKTSNSLHEFVIGQVIDVLDKYLKSTHKRSVDVTETLSDMFNNLSVGSYETSDSLDQSHDEQSIEDKTWPKKYDFYFKVKAWWEEHGDQGNTTFLWWKDFQKDWQWYGQHQDDIDIPLIPYGFTEEFIQDDDIEIVFRCNECQRLTYFIDMYKILTMREHAQGFSDDCKNCCWLFNNYFINNAHDDGFCITNSSFSDSEESEDKDFITQDFSSESEHSGDSVRAKRFLVNREKLSTPSEEEVTSPVRHTLKYDDDLDSSNEFNQKILNKKKWERNQKK